MYLLLNLDHMVIEHAHVNAFTLCELAEVDCSEYSIAMFPTNAIQSLRSLTDLELELLYRNLTGETIKAERRALVQIVFDLCKRVPQTAVDNNLSKQAECVQEGKYHKYRLSTSTPLTSDKPFPPRVRVLVRDVEAESAAKAGKITCYNTVKRPVRPVQPKPAQGKVKTTASKPSTVGRGKTIPLIHKHLGEEWEKTNKVTDKESLVAFRKLCKELLVDTIGVNNSTFSVQFGKWKKTLSI